MEEIIKKADVLIEALPYIRDFRHKIFVIKYGGKVILSETAQKRLLEDLIFLYFVGIKPVLVHGGGPFITQKAAQLGKPVRFVEGSRVTDEVMIKIVEGALKEINQRLVKMVKDLGVEAKGLDGKKEEIIRVRKKREGEIDLGFVGEITEINPSPIREVLREKAIPIIIPLGKGEDKFTYNVNADEVASAIAVSLNAEKFILLTDTKGILRNPEDEGSLISTLTQKEVEELIERKVIQTGMIPKVRACINALQGGVKKTHIIDGRINHVLLLEIFTDKGIGTEIIR
ncbi:MAG: acetylglutamate kinase [Candidatus Omnitrophica bacterium]|nr:acetylglutamate kinase [Candidatus Omnitrophota bacterium]MCM8793931.1 acetylglutamate kinase [Candidatus Omnitrophota bacterium]